MKKKLFLVIILLTLFFMPKINVLAEEKFLHNVSFSNAYILDNYFSKLAKLRIEELKDYGKDFKEAITAGIEAIEESASEVSENIKSKADYVLDLVDPGVNFIKLGNEAIVEGAKDLGEAIEEEGVGALFEDNIQEFSDMFDTLLDSVSRKNVETEDETLSPFEKTADANCGIISKEMNDFLQKIFNYIKIIAPILVVLFSTIDIIPAILSDGSDIGEKVKKKITARFVAAFVLFLLPLIINLILNLLTNYHGTCGIS